MKARGIISAEEWYTERKGARLQIKSRTPIVPYDIRFEESSEAWGKKFKAACESAFPGIEPKEIRSAGADYYEIYVKVKENNAYLGLHDGHIEIERYWENDELIYELTKAKASGLLYDLGYRV